MASALVYKRARCLVSAQISLQYRRRSYFSITMKSIVFVLIVAAVAVDAGLIAAPALIAGHPGLVSVAQPLIAPQWIAQPHAVAVTQPVVVAAPVIQPGYVAATRGSVHIAPLPGNTPLASHHLNLAPAPGTV